MSRPRRTRASRASGGGSERAPSRAPPRARRFAPAASRPPPRARSTSPSGQPPGGGGGGGCLVTASLRRRITRIADPPARRRIGRRARQRRTCVRACVRECVRRARGGCDATTRCGRVACTTLHRCACPCPCGTEPRGSRAARVRWSVEGGGASDSTRRELAAHADACAVRRRRASGGRGAPLSPARCSACRAALVPVASPAAPHACVMSSTSARHGWLHVFGEVWTPRVEHGAACSSLACHGVGAWGRTPHGKYGLARARGGGAGVRCACSCGLRDAWRPRDGADTGLCGQVAREARSSPTPTRNRPKEGQRERPRTADRRPCRARGGDRDTMIDPIQIHGGY